MISAHHSGHFILVHEYAQDLDRDDEEVPDDDEMVEGVSFNVIGARARNCNSPRRSTRGSKREAYYDEGEQLKSGDGREELVQLDFTPNILLNIE